MFKIKFIQILTICLQFCLIAVLFIPIFQEYNVTVSLWDKIVNSFKAGQASDILTYSIYYIPVIITMVLVYLLQSRVKYALAIMSSSLGFSQALVQFIFPMVQSAHLIQVYQIGLYLLIGLQLATIILCVIGVSLKYEYSDYEQVYIDTKSDTKELDVKKIKSKAKKGDLNEHK